MKLKRAKKQKKILRFVIVLAVLAFLAFAILMSPLFEINRIDIEGNRTISDVEILRASGLAVGQNLLAFSASTAEGWIEALPYVLSASVTRNFPDGLTITVTERTAVANVRLGNTSTHLLIDETGMVLETAPRPMEGQLTAIGIDFTHFAIGEYLVVDNPVVFDNILQMSRLFRRYDFFPDIVDISDPLDIVLHKGDTGIYFGDISDADRKIQYLQAISQQFPLGVRGYIEIRDINERPRFGLIR